MKTVQSPTLQKTAPSVKDAPGEAGQTMKAVRIHRYGGPEVLSYEDVPRPKPQAGEVLIRVEAMGVNPFDWKVRAGYMKDYLKHSLPLILGWDISGKVEETGAGVSQYKKGDEVYALLDPTRDGAGEYAVARTSEMAFKPKTLHHANAAAVPTAAMTAYQALFDTAKLEAGQRVLIHAGSGGVGHFAVQFAKWKGAHVISTASAMNQKWLRELGADETIDYTTQRFEDITGKVDVVFDTLGGETQERSWNVLKKGGILVSIVAPPAPEKAQFHGVRATFVACKSNAAQLAEIAALIDAGQVKPTLDRILPITEVRRAHELSQAGHTRGKVVLRVAEAG